jgi:hypothetical protein
VREMPATSLLLGLIDAHAYVLLPSWNERELAQQMMEENPELTGLAGRAAVIQRGHRHCGRGRRPTAGHRVPPAGAACHPERRSPGTGTSQRRDRLARPRRRARLGQEVISGGSSLILTMRS